VRAAKLKRADGAGKGFRFKASVQGTRQGYSKMRGNGVVWLEGARRLSWAFTEQWQ